MLRFDNMYNELFLFIVSLKYVVIVFKLSRESNGLDEFMRGWTEKAIQRKEWKAVGETYAQQWDKIG